jgi:Fe-S cluster biogenesis protein NfuA
LILPEKIPGLESRNLPFSLRGLGRSGFGQRIPEKRERLKMSVVAWIVAGLVILLLFFRSYLQYKQLKKSIESLNDRISSVAARIEEQMGTIQEELQAVKAVADNSEDSNGSGNSEIEDPLMQKFQRFLDEEINPAVAAHGGFVTLLDIKDHVAYVQMGGGCQGCGMVNVTLKQGIEARMNEVLPEIKELVDTTDHANGTNPYYQPGKGSPTL